MTKRVTFLWQMGLTVDKTGESLKKTAEAYLKLLLKDLPANL